jgi:hypothetical protein
LAKISFKYVDPVDLTGIHRTFYPAASPEYIFFLNIQETFCNNCVGVLSVLLSPLEYV